MDGTILVADDDRTIRTVLTQALTRAGCRVHATSSLTTLLRWVEEGKGDLVVTDVIMPDGNGIEMIPRISALRPGLPVIVISAQNTIMTAIQANEANAWDYLPKPFDLPDLMKRAARAMGRPGAPAAAAPAAAAAAPARIAAAPAPLSEIEDDSLPLVGRTPAMQALYRLVARVVNADLPLLITGESGAGKTALARAIHDLSDRRTRPLVSVGAGDLGAPEAVAGVLARAGGGTLVLEEIADFPPHAQAHAVRLFEGAPDPAPRIVATTQADAAARMAAGTLRDDLYYRLSGAVLAMPPVRERVDDIPLLASHFLARAAREGAAQRHLSEDALTLVRAYSWPGNVRQIEHTMRRLALTGPGPEIGRAEVEQVLGAMPAGAPLREGGGSDDRLSASVARHLRRHFDLHGGALPPPGLYGRVLREIEAPLIEIALEATGGNQARCADLLGINRNTLRKKITDLDIRVTRRRKLM